MTIVRRFLVLQLLMLWMGGFLFYSAVVVPIGTEVLRSSFEQGRITRLVTEKMNVIGVIALVLFAWELLHAKPTSRWKKYFLWGCWLIMAGTLIALFLMHPKLVSMINFDPTSKSRYFVKRNDFKFLHATYLWTITAQWIAGLLFAIVLIWSWRQGDRNTVASGE